MINTSEFQVRLTVPVDGKAGIASAVALSWASLAYMAAEGAVAITAAMIANSVALHLAVSSFRVMPGVPWKGGQRWA